MCIRDSLRLRYALANRGGAAEPATHQIGDSPYERWRIVQRFGPVQLHAAFAGELPEQDIDVKQDLHMIADETDGLHENTRLTRLPQTHDGFFHGGTEPFAARHSLALESEAPRANFGALRGHQRRRLAGLRLVRIALGNGTLGNAVRREQHGQLRSVLSASFRPADAQLLGKSRDQQRTIVPLFDKIDGERRLVPEQYLFVKSDACA